VAADSFLLSATCHLFYIKRMNILLACPGQGSQSPGMTADFESHPLTRELLQQADDTLGLHLTRTMREGSEDELRDTRTAQPALVAISCVAAMYLQHQLGKPLSQWAGATAGHSVGEYAAAVLAGAMAFPTALQLVSLRAQAMARAVPAGQGGMLAVLGLSLEQVEAIAGEATVANDNSPGQVILSGPVAAIEAAEAAAKAAGAKRALRLNVSGPFHTVAMQPAASEVARFLEIHPLAPFQLPLYFNATAQASTDVATASANLVTQITSRVRWREVMENAANDGIDTVLEVGSGKVLSGLASRCDARLSAQSLTSREAIDTWLENASTVQTTP
jgi:[acyl-carrier-protein] S-malonyltransferase